MKARAARIALPALAGVLLAAASAGAGDADGPAERFAQAFETAEAHGTLYPDIRHFAPTATIADAYRAQALVVRRRAARERIVGFKGGVTTAAQQAAMKTTEPILGVLFRSGDHLSPAAITLPANRLMGLEAEVGFVTGARIAAPVADIAALKRAIASLGPVVELPRLGFEDPAHVDATGLIAANIGSQDFVRGRSFTVAELDPDQLKPRLYRDGELIAQGAAANIAPSQWGALLWMVNRALAQYGPIAKGSLFITGSMLTPPIAKPGSYRFDYGAFGAVSVDIR